MLLERGLAVFIGQRDGPLALGMFGADFGQALLDGLEVIGHDQPADCEHARMRNGRQHVVLDQPLVQRVVLARGEGQHAVVERRALVPQAAHL
jgi:hypothetical protein